ncbi:alpha/beta-hydrolase [Ophiobolus disseminans]|uniref:Carboxylic ester hydrolase n=1 Tax=Ophiobolus disseminans TaxID=1469910 RepID=A0A6A6ZLS9_9PLEO|nr:alpha/beta-hydrolase [Ophiobolus disseminans]
MAFALVALLGFSHFHLTHAVSCRDADTTSGLVKGFVNETFPNVAQYLGIPFAEPPIGARRWLPALPKSKEHGVIDATRFGPACPQYRADATLAPNAYNVDVLQFSPEPLSLQSEDCLSLSIWAPRKAAADQSLPVIIWLYGGGYGEGGANVPYQNPAPWVERGGKHIVVSVNYRLAVFGFPNAAGLPLEGQNLGMLDQRLAVEWVRDNIANFGGDPHRITLSGQSSGAMSADHYNFAYPNDPIVSGFIFHSGTATLDFLFPDFQHTNFTYVAQHFGCSNSTATAELDCLRTINSSAIISFLETYSNTGSSPTLAFVPVVDNRTLFSNHTARALAGNFSRKPALIGNTADEGNSFVLPYNASFGPARSDADATTVGLFMCPTIQTSHDRYAANATTFRYLYAGNFSNVSPRWWLGAYHSSDLPMVFGTYSIARGNGTAFQKDVSEKMQDYWLAFAQDPVGGLPALGWESYEGGKGEGVMFGKDEVVEQKIGEARLDAPCDGLMSNGLPPPPR